VIFEEGQLNSAMSIAQKVGWEESALGAIQKGGRKKDEKLKGEEGIVPRKSVAG